MWNGTSKNVLCNSPYINGPYFAGFSNSKSVFNIFKIRSNLYFSWFLFIFSKFSRNIEHFLESDSSIVNFHFYISRYRFARIFSFFCRQFFFLICCYILAYRIQTLWVEVAILQPQGSKAICWLPCFTEKLNLNNQNCSNHFSKFQKDQN